MIRTDETRASSSESEPRGREYSPTIPDHRSARRPGVRGRVPERHADRSRFLAVANDPWCAADVRCRAGVRPARLIVHVRRGREARAGNHEPRRTRHGRGELAAIAGPTARATGRSSKNRARAGARSGDAVEPCVRWREIGPHAGSLRAERGRGDRVAGRRGGPGVRAGNPAVALDRTEEADLGAPDRHLSSAHRAARSETAVHHHAAERAGNRASA